MDIWNVFRKAKPKKEIPYFLSVDYMLANNTNMWVNAAIAAAAPLMALKPERAAEMDTILNDCIAKIQADGLRLRKEAAGKSLV